MFGSRYSDDLDPYDSDDPESPHDAADDYRSTYHIENAQHQHYQLYGEKKEKAIKNIKKWIISEFAIGCLEGAAAGLVLGLCTGGIGFIAIPLFAVWRGLHRADKAKNYTDIAVRVIDCKKPQTTSTITVNLAKGAVLGAGAGALFGLFLAPFTFGLSIPICAAIGAGCGLISAAINEVDNTKSNLSLTNTHSVRPSDERQARESAEIGLLAGAAIGLGLAPFTLGISLIVGPIVGGLIGYGISKATKPSPSPLPPEKLLTIRYATYGGAATGAAAGGLIGAFLSPITFGLSIPICALIGAAVGAFLCRQAAKSECCCPSSSSTGGSTKTHSSTSFIGNYVGGIGKTAQPNHNNQGQNPSRRRNSAIISSQHRADAGGERRKMSFSSS